VVLGLSDAISGALVGGAIAITAASITAFAASRVANRDRTSQDERALADRDHQRELVREERNQQRWQETYVDWLAYVDHWGSHSHAIESGQIAPDAPLPDWASDDALYVLRARVDAFASDRVGELATAWIEARGAYLSTLLAFQLARSLGQGGLSETQARTRAQADLNAARDRLAVQISADLRGR
jgi:hypothetical protein